MKAWIHKVNEFKILNNNFAINDEDSNFVAETNNNSIAEVTKNETNNNSIVEVTKSTANKLKKNV